MIRAEGVWKVFGPGDHGVALRLARAGAERGAVLAGCGQTIGVRDVSFEVAEGESFVVMGLSGSGKSTLVRCLAGLQPATEGSISVDGTELTGITEERLRELRRTRMAMVFQHFGLFPHRKVLDNIAYGLEVQGMARAERRRRAGEVLSLVGLDGWADHYPDQLSGGMQQRVGLGRALALDPAILFFDEPFSALDPLIRRDMQDELLRLQREHRRTLVFITHDFDEALRLGDRIAVMKDGVFEQVGAPATVVAQPATAYVRAFTRNVPLGRVLQAGAVMDVVTPADAAIARRVRADALLDDVVPLLLAERTPVLVADSRDVIVGVLRPDAVAAALGAAGGGATADGGASRP